MSQSPVPLSQFRDTMANQAKAFDYPATQVHLVAVSKTRTADEIAKLADQGQLEFGENYLQEALEKIHTLCDRGLIWHYIGKIQSNKTKPIAEHFDWVHTVDRLKIAQRLNDQRSDNAKQLNICLQVNVSGEASKGGVSLEELPQLAQQILTLPRLRLRGLMALPAPEADFDRQREAFRLVADAARQLRDQLTHTQSDLDTLSQGTQNEQFMDTLSMGTSSDYLAAIAEGATLIRIGTALFGPRDYS